MKWALLIPIKIYWFLIPETRRRICLYKESCSKYVYRNTNANGIIFGLKCLLHRVKRCNSQHEIIFLPEENTHIIRLKTGEFLQNGEINEFLISESSLVNAKL